jgi:hypothetical protein
LAGEISARAATRVAPRPTASSKGADTCRTGIFTPEWDQATRVKTARAPASVHTEETASLEQTNVADQLHLEQTLLLRRSPRPAARPAGRAPSPLSDVKVFGMFAASQGKVAKPLVLPPPAPRFWTTAKVAAATIGITLGVGIQLLIVPLLG